MSKKGKKKKKPPIVGGKINAGQGEKRRRYLGLVRGRRVFDHFSHRMGVRLQAITVRRCPRSQNVEVCVMGKNGLYLTFWRMKNTHLCSLRVHSR